MAAMSEHSVSGEDLERMKEIVTSTPANLEPDELRAWRDELGLTQAKMAARLRALGYSTASRTIRYWEAGERGTPPWLAVLRESNPLLEAR